MHHHTAWKPSLAAKPLHLATAGLQASTSAALKGATTAFASSPTIAVPNVSQLRGRYEAQSSTNDAESTRGRSSAQPPNAVQDDTAHRSPSRGRHLRPQDAILAKGARSAVSSSSPSMPAPLDRTPSMIAARLASASPTRGSGTTSPPASQGKLNIKADMGVAITKPKPSPPAIAVVSGKAQNQRVSPEAQAPVNVNFDKLPRLVPKPTATTNNLLSPHSATTLNTTQPIARQRSGNAAAPVQMPNDKRAEDSVTRNENTSVSLPLETLAARTKPAVPGPRKGRAPLRSPLQADLTGSRQFQGLSREEAINRMADAMVASSLASTRTPSPTKALQGRPTTRRSASAHQAYRLPSIENEKLPVPSKPQRPMKQTLRKASTEEEEDLVTKRGRRHLVRKHPNKHHEGDRKRWRDKVTETERRRYEGVFAANRGLLLKSADPNASPSRLMDPSSESNQVVNVIVRDIWERSRLPSQVLEQVYDLVAPNDSMVLNREQFVIGLWLIDQKLKGRKLPVRVSESVWASVRHSQGIKIGSHHY